MSTHYDANQYDGVFLPQKLQHWEVPKQYRGSTWFNDHYESVRPKCHEGFTETIANDKGHIESDRHKSRKNPWGDFIGTWDMPKKIPGTRATVQTARRYDTEDKLHRHMCEAHEVMSGQVKNTTRQMKGVPKPVDLPACAPASNLLEADKPLSPGVPIQNVASAERRSGAEAPVPVSTSPEKIASPTDYSQKPASQQSMRYEKINAL